MFPIQSLRRKRIISDVKRWALAARTLAGDKEPSRQIHRGPYSSLRSPYIERIHFFLSRAISPVLHHVHTQPTFGRPLMAGPQLVQVPRALVVRPCAHVRPRSTRWHLRWIWRCSAPREPHFWPTGNHRVLPLPPLYARSSRLSRLPTLARPYGRSRGPV